MGDVLEFLGELWFLVDLLLGDYINLALVVAILVGTWYLALWPGHVYERFGERMADRPRLARSLGAVVLVLSLLLCFQYYRTLPVGYVIGLGWRHDAMNDADIDRDARDFLDLAWPWGNERGHWTRGEQEAISPLVHHNIWLLARVDAWFLVDRLPPVGACEELDLERNPDGLFCHVAELAALVVSLPALPFEVLGYWLFSLALMAVGLVSPWVVGAFCGLRLLFDPEGSRARRTDHSRPRKQARWTAAGAVVVAAAGCALAFFAVRTGAGRQFAQEWGLGYSGLAVAFGIPMIAAVAGSVVGFLTADPSKRRSNDVSTVGCFTLMLGAAGAILIFGVAYFTGALEGGAGSIPQGGIFAAAVIPWLVGGFLGFGSFHGFP